MMLTIVVGASLVLGAAFVLVWLLRPDVREQVERPKHRFQEQVRRYDRSLHD
jgi:hypothetical protein